MADGKLTVVARCRAKPGLEAAVKEEILSLVAPTRAEPGCLNYDLHQAQADPALFLLYENWRSRKDLDEHLAMPYLAAFLGKAEKLLAEPVDIAFWDMVTTPGSR